MRSMLMLSCCLLLPACVALQPVPYVPVEEAVWFKFPRELPEDRQTIPGPMATAIQLAMDDFLPRGTRPPLFGASDLEACLLQRAAYDTLAAPGPEGVVFVSIVLSPGACEMQGPVLDAGATYAVDVHGGRILAVRR